MLQRYIFVVLLGVPSHGGVFEPTTSSCACCFWDLVNHGWGVRLFNLYPCEIATNQGILSSVFVIAALTLQR